ncbi:MAG TPA: cysteine desulfurase-like protein [Actinomycetes bacterium]|nr:cysteine desulfurase-like protein [Actinomycetes bacterium]
MSYDVERIRSLYPALSGDRVWLDGAAGTQSPTSVIDAIADAYRVGTSNGGGGFASSARADAMAQAAREAVADLTGSSEPTGVVLGPNMTTLTYRFAQALADTWLWEDNIVASRLDHDANVRPWVQWAQRAGVEIRWAQVDAATGELPVEQYSDLVDTHTKLVAVTAASNVLGTRPDVRAITDIAHSCGALVYVDGVHSTAHGVVDVKALGADFYATSAYKWDGPHVGAVVADPGLLEPLRPFKLASSSSEIPDRFEWGTPSYANFAGVAAAVDHLAALDPAVTGTRRARLVASLTAAHEHEQRLLARILDAIDADPRVTTYGKPKARTATVYFNVAGQTPEKTAELLDLAGINAWHGHNYAWETTDALGIRDSGSAVRVSLSHYSNDSDVDQLIAAVCG